MGAGRSNCLSCLSESRSDARQARWCSTRKLSGRRSSRTLSVGAHLASRVPRYHQIAQTLRERIATSGQGPGERLDNQRSLARDGLIARRHGLGTFVARPAIDYDILQLRALAGDLSALGEDVATRFLRSHFAAADRRVAEALGLAEQAEVFVLERLRLVDGEPVSFQASYLPAALGAEVSRFDLAVTPLRQVLTFKLGIEITAARETVSAVPLDRRAAC